MKPVAIDVYKRQAQAADLAQARIVVVAEVARNYFELRGAEQRLAVARANLDSQRDSLRVIQAMVSAGRGDEGDLASARAELETVQASVPLQETARRLALYRLAVLAGLRPVELGDLDAATPQPPLAARLPIGDVGALLSRRPDIRAAERNMAAANACLLYTSWPSAAMATSSWARTTANPTTAISPGSPCCSRPAWASA